MTNPAPGGGASNSVNFIVGNPIPVITLLLPSSIASGSEAQTLAVNGSNFLNSSSVSFNGSARAATFISSSELTIDLTSTDLAAPGTLPLTVINPPPAGGTSNVVNLIVSSASTGSVSLSPMSATVPEGGLQSFTATVVGSSDGVTWSIEEGTAGGTIVFSSSSTATYTPPSSTGTFHVVATSIDNSSQSAMATVAVVSPLQFTVLHSFIGTDGATPTGGLIQASDGNFYGTTAGGTSAAEGTVFKVDGSGNLTALHSFSSTGGGIPYAGLIQASDGNFYGTTFLGGTSSNCQAILPGCGMIFKLDASGNLTLLHSFTGTDGEFPYAGLIQASDGNFYGTTFEGGMSSNCTNGCGTVFKMDTSGNLTILHSFIVTDGLLLYARLIQGSDSNFYGTTSALPLGGGAVFKIDGSGNLTILNTFSPPPINGFGPTAGLIQGTDGNFYGTTAGGGTSSNCTSGCGTVYKMDGSGNLTVLHSFIGTDGVDPSAGLIQASDGNFYGTTFEGGMSSNCTNGCGTIFRMDSLGNLTVVHSFSGTDGSNPFLGSLIQGTDGNLYGTASAGGTADDGVIFRLDLTAFTCAAMAQQKSAATKSH